MLKVKLQNEKLSFCPMKGKPGHCFAAQVFDSNGYNVASIDSIHGAKRATAYAKLFASSLDMKKDIQSLILSITSHPDYVNGSEYDEWHTLVRQAEKTLK